MSNVLQKSAQNTHKARGRLDPEGAARHIQFRTIPAPADLTDLMENAWSVSWPDMGDKVYNCEEVMQRPYVDVFVSEQRSGIQGTFRGKRTYVATGKNRIIGIRLRPAVFHLLWDGSMADLQNKILDIQEVFPEVNEHFITRQATQDEQSVIEELASLIRTARLPRDANVELVNKIIATIETDPSLTTVASVAHKFGKSERWLQQLFQEYVGIGLKWLLQRQKLLGAAEHIRQADQPDWATIAYDLGYSSQQHFITDFKKVLDKTPLQYKKDLAKK